MQSRQYADLVHFGQTALQSTVEHLRMQIAGVLEGLKFVDWDHLLDQVLRDEATQNTVVLIISDLCWSLIMEI